MKKYDLIVVGGGISGVTAAAVISRSYEEMYFHLQALDEE